MMTRLYAVVRGKADASRALCHSPRRQPAAVRRFGADLIRIVHNLFNVNAIETTYRREIGPLLVESVLPPWSVLQRKRDQVTEATALLITADAGGSNGYRSRTWKQDLQGLADDLRLPIHVSPFPPGTSKWNKIEHRLFCHITENWRGRPLRTFETMVDLIGHTRTAAGLRVKAKLDKRRYPTGRIVTRAEMQDLALHPHAFHGDWNYELRPRPR